MASFHNRCEVLFKSLFDVAEKYCVLSLRSTNTISSSENTKRNRVFQEGVDFGAIASMMAKVTAEQIEIIQSKLTQKRTMVVIKI